MIWYIIFSTIGILLACAFLFRGDTLRQWYFQNVLACRRCRTARYTKKFWRGWNDIVKVCDDCHRHFQDLRDKAEERYQINRYKEKLRLQAKARAEFEAERQRGYRAN